MRGRLRGCELKIVKQVDTTDCGIACITMVAKNKFPQLNYRKVKDDMKSCGCFTNPNDNNFSTFPSDLLIALKKYKIKFSQPSYYRKINWKFSKNAIVSIRHRYYKKKKETTFHWVVYDKEKNVVHDPELNKERNRFSRMKIWSYIYVNV